MLHVAASAGVEQASGRAGDVFGRDALRSPASTAVDSRGASLGGDAALQRQQTRIPRRLPASRREVAGPL